MKQRNALLALLVAAGSIGGVAVFVPKGGTTWEELAAAGINECQSVGIECPVLIYLPENKIRRTRMLLEGRRCLSDEGTEFLVPLQYWDMNVPNWSKCEFSTADGGWPKELEP